MDEAYKSAIRANLASRREERRQLTAKIQVLDKQINDLEKELSQADTKASTTKPATKTTTKPKTPKTTRKVTK